MIWGLYPLFTPEHKDAREKLLTPIYKQMMAVKAYRKRHRKVRDIDPDNGKIVVKG